MRKRPSTATVIASVALVFSLAGTGLAASRYVITSTSQIKPSVIEQLQGVQGPQGPRGKRGKIGTAGVAGVAGATGATGVTGPVALATIVQVPGPLLPIPADGVQESVATCPAGSHVVSGGAESTDPNGVAVSAMTSDASSWFVISANPTIITTETVQAFAYCTVAGEAVASNAGIAVLEHRRAVREAKRLVRRIERTMWASQEG